MRVLSVVSTLILAVTSLAATTPATSNPLQQLVSSVSALNDPAANGVSNEAANGLANRLANGASQVPYSSDVQNFVNTLNSAWMGMNDQSCSPAWKGNSWSMGGGQGDLDQLLKCITAIKNVVCESVEKLRTVHRESSLTESDMAALVPTVFGFLTTLSTFLIGLIQAVVGALTGPGASNILEALNDLLNCVSELVEVLRSCIVDPHAHFLAPIFKLIECIVKEIARLFGFKDVW